MHDSHRLKHVRDLLRLGDLAGARANVLAWFADYKLELQLFPNLDRAKSPDLWNAVADMAELAGDHRLPEQVWQLLESIVPKPPIKNVLPLLGVPIVNGPERLQALLASLDVQVNTLAIVDHSEKHSSVYKLLNRLEQKGVPGVERVCVARPFGNAGVAAAWNAILRGFPRAPYALIANHDVVFAPGVLPHVMDAVDCRKPQWLPLLSRPAAFSAFVITPLVWNRIGLFDDSFVPAYWEDTDYRDRLECDPAIECIQSGPWLQAMDAANPSHSASLADDPKLAKTNASSFALNRLWYFSRRRVQNDRRGAWVRAWLQRGDA